MNEVNIKKQTNIFIISIPNQIEQNFECYFSILFVKRAAF
jgi:hypothetical protein